MTTEYLAEYRRQAALKILCSLLLSRSEKEVINRLSSDPLTQDILMVDRALTLTDHLMKGLEEK